MRGKTIGVAVAGTDAPDLLKQIEEFERLGVQSAWLAGSIMMDALTLMGAAAVRTQRIKLGTGIFHSWSRQPVAAAQQARTLAGLAPGRIRLGIGPSNPLAIEANYGLQPTALLGHLRDYVTIVRTLLREGKVEYKGKHYQSRATLPAPVPDVPVVISALRERSFEVAGEVADGAIPLLTPPYYLRDVALPAMERGARKAGRAAPPLIIAVAVCMGDDLKQVHESARQRLTRYIANPNSGYTHMFVAAGFPEAAKGEFSDRMIDAATAIGNEEQVTKRIKEYASLGAEVYAEIHPHGDPVASRRRAVELMAALAKAD
jgi:alkanesulfonate monooxygenase SsuD/methylene tetrahydromethanopterin reductase-like flavin-dependent oxidoreductase (luciferase family)